MPEDDFSTENIAKNKNVFIIVLSVTIVLTLALFASYRYAKEKTTAIVLPGGSTYLGPSETPTSPVPRGTSTIPIPENTKWTGYKGKLFPYSFSQPSSLSLGFFPDDPFDSVTIFWNNTNPSQNLLLRVENLNKDPNMTGYINKSKKIYAENWWKQYNYEGVGTVTQFTNSNGLIGYRARYRGLTYDNIFLEVPNRPELVIWMSSKLLDQSTFDRIVDSVKWEK